MSEYQPTVDQEATNKFGEIFDQLLTENPDVLKTAKGRHALNVFFTQLLFCFFAEELQERQGGLFKVLRMGEGD